jgi:hypothetical protein
VDGVTVVDWPLLTHNRLQVQLKHSDGRQLVADQTCSGHGAKWHVSTLNARRFLLHPASDGCMLLHVLAGV